MTERRRLPSKRIPAQIWASAAFRNLSPIPPSGQTLYLWLLCGPLATNIPGVICAGRHKMAEELNWSIDAFDAALADGMANGMIQFDENARLLVCPQAIADIPPESPNVIRSWKKSWPLLPECQLLEDVEILMRASLKQHHPLFRSSFEEVLESVAERRVTPKIAVSASKPAKRVAPAIATTETPITKPVVVRAEESAPTPEPDPAEVHPEERGENVFAVVESNNGPVSVMESWAHDWIDEFPTLNIVNEIDRLRVYLLRDDVQRPKPTHMRAWLQMSLEAKKNAV